MPGVINQQWKNIDRIRNRMRVTSSHVQIHPSMNGREADTYRVHVASEETQSLLHTSTSRCRLSMSRIQIDKHWLFKKLMVFSSHLIQSSIAGTQRTHTHTHNNIVLVVVVCAPYWQWNIYNANECDWKRYVYRAYDVGTVLNANGTVDSRHQCQLTLRQYNERTTKDSICKSLRSLAPYSSSEWLLCAMLL